jgi:hypothetical protein
MTPTVSIVTEYYRFKPKPVEMEVTAQGDITKYIFANLPRTLTVPYISIEATVTARETAFLPSSRTTSDELLRPTEFWCILVQVAFLRV